MVSFYRYCPDDAEPRFTHQLSEDELVDLIGSDSLVITRQDTPNETLDSVREQLRIVLSLKRQNLL